MPFNTEKLLFSFLSILFVLVFLFLALYPLIKHFYYKKFTIKAYYSKIRKIALYNDFLLVNEFSSQTLSSETYHIDHILIGNKYIYCIKDRYYPGTILALANDESWLFYGRKEPAYFQNPMRLNEFRINKFSLSTGLPKESIISIVLINNDCLINEIPNRGDHSYCVSLSKLEKLILEIESRDIGNLNKSDLEYFANDLVRRKSEKK